MISARILTVCKISPPCASNQIKKLEKRLTSDIKEVILALDPSLEGETTSLYLSRIIKDKNIRVSRIASGIPMGGNIEFSDIATLSRSLEGRKEI